METQPALLAAILAQKSEPLAATYQAFREAIDGALASGRLEARHGPDHWRNLGVLSARLVPERIFQQLAAAEVFVLAAAAIAHDCAPPGTTSAEWLVDAPDDWSLDSSLATAVRQVCEAVHSGGRRLRRTARWGYMERDAVDLRRAGSVLLIADRIDLEHTDCPLPEEVNEQEDIDLSRPDRWPQVLGLSVGLIDPREGVLRLDLTASNKVWTRILEEHFLPHAEAAMTVARNILLASGMPFREIELHDLHAKPSADVARAQEVMRARAGARRRPEKPFKFLEAYGEEEHHLLAARDEEILKLAGRALTTPLCVLTGEVGVGKTSLCAAGLLPWLRMNGYDGVMARCLNDPTQSLLHAAQARLGREVAEPAVETSVALAHACRALAEESDSPVVLVLDQCQELFTRLGSRTRQEFAKDLAGLLALPGEPVHVVLVIQREFFVSLTELLPVLPTLFNEVMELRRLTADQAETVIRRALGRFRQRFDSLVSGHLIDDLATADGILPLELQICCDALILSLDEGEYHVGFEYYRKIGPARRILEGVIDQRLKTFRWRRHTLAKNALVDAVTSQRTKALLTAEECAVDIGCDPATAREILEELLGLGLLKRLRVGDRWVYELSHEYLALRLEPWIGDVEREAKDVDDLLHRELNNYDKFQLLLDREKIKLIHQYRRRLTLTPEELELVIRSSAAERFEMDYWFGRVNELSLSQQMVLSVDLLYSPEPELRDALRSMITKLDHQAVLPTLLDSLREAEPAVQSTAIEVLREIDENLVKALEQGDAATQQQAAYALGQIGARHAVRPLVEQAQFGTDEVREQAVEALAEIDRSKSADLLIKSLRTGSAESRWNAAVALGRLGRDQQIRERIRREADRSDATDSLRFAYAKACLEGRQFEESQRLLDDLERRAVPDSQRYRIEQAREELARLGREHERGVFTWPMYRGGLSGAAYTPQGLKLPLELKWEFATRDMVYSSPAVANGAVFVGSTDHRLYALDAESGSVLWTADVGQEVRSSPCVLAGKVIFSDITGRLHAVEQDTGRELWSAAVGATPDCSVRGDEQQAFVGTSGGALLAFNPQDGQRLWQTRLDGEVVASAACDGTSVAIGTPESGLVLLSAEDGQERWRWRVHGGLHGSPVLVDGQVVVGSGDGRLELLDTDGTLLWTSFLRSEIECSPAVGHGRVVIGSADGEVACFELTTGRTIWRFDAEGDISASPTIAGRTVFIGSHAGQLYALRADNGKLTWRYRTGYSIHSTPAVADGRLFVALRYYNMCAFAEPVDVEEPRR